MASLSKTASAAGFDSIYGKMNATVGYNLQEYTGGNTGGIDKLFDKTKNAALEYKMHRANHAVSIGVGYNFYLDFNNIFHPFAGIEATVRIPVMGYQTLRASYDKSFDSLGLFGGGDGFTYEKPVVISTMPQGTVSGMVQNNGDGSWTVTYFNRSGQPIEGGTEVRYDFAPGTLGGYIEQEENGTWTAHLVNGATWRTYEERNYVGRWVDPNAVPEEDTEEGFNGFTISLKAHEYMVLNAKAGCRIFLNNSVSLSPYGTIGLNIAQAKVNIGFHDRTIDNSTTNIGLSVGLGLESIVMDKLSIAIEYRRTVNKFNFATYGDKLRVQSNNLNVKVGYYFL